MVEGEGEQELLSLKRNDDMMGYGSIDIYTPGNWSCWNWTKWNTCYKWKNTGCCTDGIVIIS
jgi:hypothetical protein